MIESMITVCLQYYINAARALLLSAEVMRACFFFFQLISRSHFSHPNFTNCKLHTRMLTDADLWHVFSDRLCITHKVKKTWDPADHLKYRPKPLRVSGPRSSGLGSSLKTSNVLLMSYICDEKKVLKIDNMKRSAFQS